MDWIVDGSELKRKENNTGERTGITHNSDNKTFFRQVVRLVPRVRFKLKTGETVFLEHTVDLSLSVAFLREL